VFRGYGWKIGRREMDNSYALETDLYEIYQAMAAEKEREEAALEWSNALIEDVPDET